MNSRIGSTMTKRQSKLKATIQACSYYKQAKKRARVTAYLEQCSYVPKEYHSSGAKLLSVSLF
jgi:hydroxyethylthiazole kinase-like sugar kinase family protein